MGDAVQQKEVEFAVVGVDHPHAHLLTAELERAGARCVGFVDTTAQDGSTFTALYPTVPMLDLDDLFEDAPPLIIVGSVPNERAQFALEALDAGADVLAAKPGATSQDQLAKIEAVTGATGRRWWVAFTEDFCSRAATRAHTLAQSGRIGTVRHVLGLGPHRTGDHRPDWFTNPLLSGSMLADLASHQIHHAMRLLGTDELKVVTARTTPAPNGTHPELVGEVLLEGGTGSAYCRVDWLTPAGLPTWGDVRLMITGDEGTIEVRANCDIAGRDGADHVIICDRDGVEHIICADDALTWPTQLLADVRDRTETATSTAHSIAVSRLALRAADIARR